MPTTLYATPAYYAVASVDGHGRIASSSTLHVLGWEPGTVVAFVVDSNRRITVARSIAEPAHHSTAPRRAITPRGNLNLPVLTRRQAGIARGDRILLAADERADMLHMYPPKVLAVILHSSTIEQAKQP